MGTNRLIKFLICMIVPLIKKLRRILSNKRHSLKQAFQERTYPRVNQQCLRRCIRRLKDASEIHPCRLCIETSVLHCVPLGLCALHVEIKGEISKQKYYKI